MGFFDWSKKLMPRMAARRAARDEEAALIAEMDRILSEVHSKIPLARKYRKRLLPSVRSALEAVSGMVRLIPGPFEPITETPEKMSILQYFFTNTDDLFQWFKESRKLSDGFNRSNADALFAVVASNYREKTVFGAKQQGQILQRDVMYRTVLFADPEILLVAENTASVLKELQHRILVMLFIRALDEIQDMKSWMQELEHLHDLLEFKLGGAASMDLQHNSELGEEDAENTEKLFLSVQDKLNDLDRASLDTPEDHLSHVTTALTGLAAYLNIVVRKIRLDDRGYIVDQNTAEPVSELEFAECAYTGKEKRAVILTRISRNGLR